VRNVFTGLPCITFSFKRPESVFNLKAILLNIVSLRKRTLQKFTKNLIVGFDHADLYLMSSILKKSLNWARRNKLYIVGVIV
jgi:hypothetical protein